MDLKLETIVWRRFVYTRLTDSAPEAVADGISSGFGFGFGFAFANDLNKLDTSFFADLSEVFPWLLRALEGFALLEETSLPVLVGGDSSFLTGCFGASETLAVTGFAGAGGGA